VSRPRSASRPSLTRERVLRAAVAFADENGVDALSMRKLGQMLGVEAMSLYHYVANKNDLLDGARDLVAAEIELPTGDVAWKAAMRSTAISAHRMLRRHPWASGLWHRGTPGAARLRYMESMLATCRRAGFGVEAAYHAYHVLDTFVVGFTTQQLSFPLGAEQLAKVAADFLAELPAGDYPYIAEHVREHLDGSPHANEFEFGLDLILDGLDRIGRAP
jgi:AcrR family transcriptional regulator